MKYQQVSVDLVNMVMTACSYLALAGAVWILLRLLQACFWLPRHFRKQNDVQKLLQDKVDNYEKYLAECEARDKLAGVDCNLDDINDDATATDVPKRSEKWRGQKETLEMLKKKLSRIRNGTNVTDWDYLLEKNQAEAVISENDTRNKNRSRKDLKKEEAANTTEVFTAECDKESGAECVDEKKDK